MSRLIKTFIILLLAPLTSNAMMQPVNPGQVLILPTEMHYKIIMQVIASSATLPESTKAIRTWSHVNQSCFRAINSPDVIKNIIESLKGKFGPVADSKVIFLLRTGGAGNYFKEILEENPALCEFYIKGMGSFDKLKHPNLPRFVITYIPQDIGILKAAIGSIMRERIAYGGNGGNDGIARAVFQLEHLIALQNKKIND